MKKRMKRLMGIVLGAVILVGVNTVGIHQSEKEENASNELESTIDYETDTENEDIIEVTMDRVDGSIGKISMSAYVVMNEEQNTVTSGTGFNGYGAICESTVRIYYKVGEQYYYVENTNTTTQQDGISATLTKKDVNIVGAQGIHKITYGDVTWTPITSIGIIPEDAQKE